MESCALSVCRIWLYQVGLSVTVNMYTGSAPFIRYLWRRLVWMRETITLRICLARFGRKYIAKKKCCEKTKTKETHVHETGERAETSISHFIPCTKRPIGGFRWHSRQSRLRASIEFYPNAHLIWLCFEQAACDIAHFTSLHGDPKKHGTNESISSSTEYNTTTKKHRFCYWLKRKHFLAGQMKLRKNAVSFMINWFLIQFCAHSLLSSVFHSISRFGSFLIRSPFGPMHSWPISLMRCGSFPVSHTRKTIDCD